MRFLLRINEPCRAGASRLDPHTHTAAENRSAQVRQGLLLLPRCPVSDQLQQKRNNPGLADTPGILPAQGNLLVLPHIPCPKQVYTPSPELAEKHKAEASCQDLLPDRGKLFHLHHASHIGTMIS